MLKRPKASARQSSRLSAATMKPLPCARKPQSASRALKISRPWSVCMLSGAKSTLRNGNTRKVAVNIAAFRHFRWRFSTSRWAACGWTRTGWMTHAGHSTQRWRRVPAYAQAQGHLAEVEAQLGEIESAVASLHSLAASSDDPDYAAQLARILADAGRDGESRHWRRLAEVRYDELLAWHPEAFADHAAEFWLAAGADPDKALRLAKMNLAVRNTPRARALLARASCRKGVSCRRQILDTSLIRSEHEIGWLFHHKTLPQGSRLEHLTA